MNSAGTVYGEDQSFTTLSCNDVLLTSSVTMSGEQVGTGKWKYYSVTVPAGATSVTFATTNATADVDIYAQFAAKPTLEAYVCHPQSYSGNEACSIRNPKTGIWWLGVYGYDAGSYSITGTVTTGINDLLLLQATSPAVVGAGQGDDTYILDGALLNRQQRLTLSDGQGKNILQLVSGLSIDESKIAPNTLHLTLSNRAQVTLLGANTFFYDAGGNAAAGITHPPVAFATFVQSTLGVTVPNSGVVTGSAVTIP